jgi:hypothetical protein
VDALRAHAIEEQVLARLDLGEHAAVAAELEDLVGRHGFRERLWAALMLALYRSGRQAEALAAYRRVSMQMREELGIEPSGELRVLERRILIHDPSLALPAPPLTNLPSPATSMVGREREARQISALLDSSRLVTLTGVGGVGKTRLAIEVAGGMLAASPDGVWLVDLGSIVDADRVPAAAARLLRLPEQETRPTVDLLAGFLRAKQVLLVLDTCEHVRSAAAALVAALMAAAPGLRVLITSRQPLRLGAEVVVEVEPLRLPELRAATEEIAESDAVCLLVARAEAAVPGLKVGPDDLPGLRGCAAGWMASRWLSSSSHLGCVPSPRRPSLPIGWSAAPT